MRQTKKPADRLIVVPPHDDSSTFRERLGAIALSNPDSGQLDSNSRQAIIAAAWQDMRRRRRDGKSVQAQDYFVQEGGITDESLAVDMIYAEYVLRLESGEVPRLVEYLERFPQFAAAIKRQLEVHEGMESSDNCRTWNLTPESDVRLAKEQMPVSDPTHLGKYVLLSKLSAGGQATVYRAVHPTLGRELVLKLSHKSFVENSSAASRLLEEGRILAELDHPNLARVYDMGLDDGYPYLAMEYVRGQTLDQYANDKKLNWRDRARIVAKVAAAVSLAHQKNVVHLDIKPRNIVVDEQGNPRLLDFGLARLFDAFHDSSGKADISGTLQFMAPEQARGDGALIGRRTDIFGLGGVLYFVLTNKAPYPGSNPKELLPRISNGEWEAKPLNDVPVPRRLRSICTRAMAPKVEDRYGSAEDFAAALHRLVRYSQLWRGLAKAAVLLLFVSAAVLFFRPSAPATSDVTPALAAKVRQADGHYTELAHALPLHSGDQLKFHGGIPAGMHAALFVLTSSGDLQQLASWEPVQELQQIQYPAEASAAVPLDKRSGTEFIFLCTRPERPILLDEVRGAWNGAKPLEPLPDYTVAMIESENIRFENFGKGLGPIVQHDNLENTFQQRLRPVLEQLKKQFSDVVGIAFTHKR